MAQIGRPLALAAAIGGAALMLTGCGGASTATPVPAPSGVIAIEAKEFLFAPSTLSVPAGAVTFWVRNAGTVEHEFEIFKGEQVVNEIEGLVPGLAKTLSVTLAAGDYTFVCKLSGHDQLGMKGTLTVTGG
ncbi:MAG: cupredoxin domain-containing protein [Chloroflexota bacterium]